MSGQVLNGAGGRKGNRANLSPMEVHDGWIENLKAERRTQIK